MPSNPNELPGSDLLRANAGNLPSLFTWPKTGAGGGGRRRPAETGPDPMDIPVAEPIETKP